MAKCGLDRKYIAAIIGHKSKLASESHYLDWAETEARWLELCEPKMSWLIERIEIVKEVVDPQARKALAELIAFLRTAGDSGDLADIGPALGQAERALLEDKPNAKARS